MTTTEYRNSAHKAALQQIMVMPSMVDALATLRLSATPKEDHLIQPWHPGYERWASHKQTLLIGYHLALQELERLATDMGSNEIPLEVARPYAVQGMNEVLKDAPPEIREHLKKHMEHSIRQGTRTPPCPDNQP